MQTGFGDKLNIVRNIAGINIMVSHNLPAISAESLSTSAGESATAITGKGCIAMSMADSTSMPFMGVVRQRLKRNSSVIPTLNVMSGQLLVVTGLH